jgi:hypothetical protein
MRRNDRRGRTLCSYPSLDRFYKADPRRIVSRERDIGLWWRDALDQPLHRAAWVSETGELYLVRLGAAEDGGGSVELLAQGAEERQVERTLAGWREHCGEPRSLSWLRDRAGRLGRRVRSSPRKAAVAAAPS